MKNPGSPGEHKAQKMFSSSNRALVFYNNQMLHCLNPLMQQFIQRQEMVFIATADASGECDSSFRAGLPGFIHVLDSTTLIYPEYRGNGVMASLGNILENPHIGLVFIDFFETTIGLHVNGKARIIENQEVALLPHLPLAIQLALNVKGRRKPERWVIISVVEAYIHCSKHVPLLRKLDKKIHWGTDSSQHKGGDYFKTKT
jgi:predicted pyridoxine 5'-phosphate oxidase superfamily flavin-nucleotide-binding protein